MNRYPSLCDLFKRVYPEYSWDEAQFRNPSRSDLTDITQQRLVLDSIGNDLNIKQVYLLIDKFTFTQDLR